MAHIAEHDPMTPSVARVVDRERETHDVWTLELEPETDDLPFAPGQFNMLYVLGVGEVPISMSGDPTKPGLVHTIRGVGAVSDALIALEPGDRLGVRGPFGTAWPVEEAIGKDVVIMAGGIGLAPLRPILYRVFAEREKFGRVSLLYGTRSPEDILFHAELDEWAQHEMTHIGVTVDHAASAWTGPVGVVTTLVKPDLFDPAKTVAFLCGPEVMMRFAVSALMDGGLPASAIHISMERNMKCAIGLCGHCQFNRTFICKDGPVFRFDALRDILAVREL